ncbi:XRE family transcriptional regulator [Pseudoflavonifractor sp. 60]|uniref:helix-turn-helix domain-containing protein n=1 Tax=Pseudoflavonifractor sp. 60 TaxID=2304576 RepID=UPI00136A6009|nr:helix-turn-helix transcriptional regulator [Pseudoflavonifractor sp. 60]NBI68207.1 XRE family transcriptional regulator [Pseudoflavonifractor sp. 60]
MDAETKRIHELYPGYEDVELKPTSFGERLRRIRKEMGETQDEFAARIGTSKQVLSRYEGGQRIPKISLVESYAKALNVSVDYLMGESQQESAFDSICTQSDKPFYKIFIDVTMEMGLLIPDIVRVTGLTDRQVRTIIFRRMKEAPLPIALQLSKTLDVPLEVWTGNESYKVGEISPEAKEVARAYDRASLKDKNTARLALDLEPVREVKRE